MFEIFTSYKGPSKEEELRLLKTYYKDCKTAPPTKDGVIVMIDGRATHGGLSDRLKAIVSVYLYCKDRGLDYYLHFVYPFKIESYLRPNIYDWRISPEEISYNPLYARPVCLNTYMMNLNLHKIKLDWLVKSRKQIHIYGETLFNDIRFSEGFHDLFTPVTNLKKIVCFHLTELKGSYKAMVFRFQSLLNDFDEGNNKTLPIAKREELILRCKQKIKDVYYSNCSNNMSEKVLVTSDSTSFLARLTDLPFVKIIPGKVVHMDYTVGARDDIYMKSFVDMYMIAHADTIYMVQTGDMYHSGFPYRCSLIFGHKYKEIIF